MAPNTADTMGGESSETALLPSDKALDVPYKPIPYKMEIIPHKLIALLLFHGLAVYGLIYCEHPKWQTQLFAPLIGLFGSIGVQVGAHRLWAHRCFKANTGLRLFLAFWFTFSFQETVYEWARDHRCHHKFADTDADPYNAKRGFFFSHVGWIVLKKHPEVLRKGKTIDMSDIEGDPILAFQKRWFWPLLFLIWGVFPTYIPVYFWGEDVTLAIMSCVILRTVLTLNVTWLVNSWAHMYGYRPYDERITPVECHTIRHALLGEGFHNYHHSFPWDYSASELGPLEVFNPATAFIDFCHYMGWASDLKRANGSLVEKKKASIVGGKDRTVKSAFVKEWIGGWLTVFAIVVLLPRALSYLLRYIVGIV